MRPRLWSRWPPRRSPFAASACDDLQIPPVRRKHSAAFRAADHDHVLGARAKFAGDEDARLDGEAHALLQDRCIATIEVWRLVHVQPDAVAEAVPKPVAAAAVFDDFARQRIHVLRRARAGLK